MRCIIFWGLNPKKEKRLHVEQLLSDNSWPLLSALANGNRLMTQAEAKIDETMHRIPYKKCSEMVDKMTRFLWQVLMGIT